MKDSKPKATLGQAQRIRKRPEFLRIQESQWRVSTRHLSFLLDQGPDEAPARLGIVASKKVGGAVERNRCKRLVREVFRLHQEAFPRGLEVVVIVRPGTHELAFQELEAEVVGVRDMLLRRARDLRHRR